MDELIQKLKILFSEAAMDSVLRILGAVLLLVIGMFLIKWLMRIVKRAKAFRRVDKSVFSFVTSMASISLKVLLILTVATMVGVPTTSIVALVGSVGLAVGLSLQGSLGNLAGGVIILLFKPFEVGDYITSPGNESGTVTDISIFYTTLATVDNKIVTIPNGELSNKSLINFSRMPTRRIDLKVGVAYDSDIETVRAALLRVAEANPKLHREPELFARLVQLGDSALIFELRAWCNNADYYGCLFDLNEGVKRELDRIGVSIPFPQLDVHIDRV